LRNVEEPEEEVQEVKMKILCPYCSRKLNPEQLNKHVKNNHPEEWSGSDDEHIKTIKNSTPLQSLRPRLNLPIKKSPT